MKGRAVLGGCAVIFAIAWNFTNIGPVADLEAHAYGVSLTIVGLFPTLVVLGHTIANIPAGRVIDRIGSLPAMAGGLLLLAALNVALLTTPSPALSLVCHLAFGIGTGAAFVGSSDYVRTMSGSAVAQGFIGGAAVGGSGVAVGIVPQLDGWLGWRAPYWSGLAVVGLGLLILAASPRPPAHVPRPRVDLRSVLADARLYRLGLLHAASMGFSLVVGVWVVVFLTRQTDMSRQLAGAVGELILVLGFVTRPYGGWLLRHRPRLVRRALQGGFVAGGVAVAVLAATPSLPVIVVAAAVAGLAAGLPFGPALHAGSVLRSDAPAAAVGLVNMCGNIVFLAGTPLVGLAFSVRHGGVVAFALIAGLWAAAALAVPAASTFGIAGDQAAGAAGAARSTT